MDHCEAAVADPGNARPNVSRVRIGHRPAEIARYARKNGPNFFHIGCQMPIREVLDSGGFRLPEVDSG
jgi:hypothetical protein